MFKRLDELEIYSFNGPEADFYANLVCNEDDLDAQCLVLQFYASEPYFLSKRTEFGVR